MRRIEFIAPVEAMRGNLSGKQRLLYAENNNPAWEAPEGKHYARNYKPRYIGAKRAANGHTYFTTRTKHAITNTEASRLVQGTMPAAAALHLIVMRNLTWIAPMQQLYELSSAFANGDSLYKWFCDTAVPAIKRKSVSVIFTEYDPATETMRRMRFSNPFVDGSGITDPADFPVGYDSAILDKFWETLSPTGKRFVVEGMQGIFFDDMNWENLQSSYGGTYNILGTTSAEVGANDYVKLGDMWLQHADLDAAEVEWNYVKADDPVYSTLPPSTEAYRLVATAPTA